MQIIMNWQYYECNNVLEITLKKQGSALMLIHILDLFWMAYNEDVGRNRPYIIKSQITPI